MARPGSTGSGASRRAPVSSPQRPAAVHANRQDDHHRCRLARDTSVCVDLSAAAHERAGLGRYATALTEAMVARGVGLGVRQRHTGVASAAAAQRPPDVHGPPSAETVEVAGGGLLLRWPRPGPGLPRRRALPRDRAPPAEADPRAQRVHAPRHRLPPVPGAPPSEEPHLPAHDDAALPPPRRSHHRRLGEHAPRRPSLLPARSGEDRGDPRGVEPGSDPKSIPTAPSRPSPVRAARTVRSLGRHDRAGRTSRPSPKRSQRCGRSTRASASSSRAAAAGSTSASSSRCARSDSATASSSPITSPTRTCPPS